MPRTPPRGVCIVELRTPATHGPMLRGVRIPKHREIIVQSKLSYVTVSGLSTKVHQQASGASSSDAAVYMGRIKASQE
uniref:Uncharacterized protein n=1 Tax=Panagrellus redivivus TaxID=6233 RepID=A0A7E4VPC1_PANRE